MEDKLSTHFKNVFGFVPDWLNEKPLPMPYDENEMPLSATPDRYTPVWGTVPKYCNWVAVDPSGHTSAYSEKPKIKTYSLGGSMWRADTGESYHLGYGKKITDDSWREMIYERPKQ